MTEEEVSLTRADIARALSHAESTILECLPTPLLIWDRDFRILFASDSAEQTLGYEPAELEGRHVDDLVPEQLRERYRKLRQNFVRDRETPNTALRGERILKTKDGREIPIELVVAPVVLQGQGVYLAGFVDISSQKYAEQETIERLHSIVEHAEVGIFLIQVTEDRTFLFESFNPITEKLTGLKSEQARGRKPDQVVPEGEAARIIQNYERCVNLGIPITYEEVSESLIGGKTFRTTLVPIRNSQGRVHRIIGLAHDITEQKRAERDLAAVRRSLGESEEKFRKVFSVCPHPISITEVSTGRLLEVNDAFERVFGYSREQSLGKTTFELGLWRDLETRSQMLAKIRERGSFRDLEAQGIDHLGSVLSLLLSGEVIEIESTPCLVTYVHDVTDERANKRALAESEERFSKAFGASPDALAILDFENGRLLEVNEGFVRLFGRPRSEVIGKSSVEVGMWANLTAREQAIAIIREQGVLVDYAMEARRASGESRACLLSCEAIEIGGRQCAVATIRDVTEARKAEQERADLERQLRQSQKLDALGTLAGGIAHDFNNILGAIQAYSELIKLDSGEPALVETHTVELQRAADRAADLVRQILTFSRKQPQPRRSPVNLEEAVHEALSFVRAALSSTIQLSVELDPAIPLVMADATQLHQVIMNLCTNAAHSMKARQGVLRVRLQAVDVDAAMRRAIPELLEWRYARLCITDTGEGIAPELLKHIFEPFFTTKPPGEGTGLGLSVVHGIVREHQGVIAVDSTVGHGTSVSVYLPEYAEQLRESEAPESELVRGNGELVMFVDDERVLCQAVPELLERLGYRVEAHTSPTTALSSFARRANEYSVVLTDLTMPVMTGLELAEKVRAITPHVPIVIMTGFGGSLTPESVRPLGIRDVIMKPLSAGAIAKCLGACLAEPRESTPIALRV